MAYQFSEIQIIAKEEISPKIIVGGTPTCAEDLVSWTEVKNFLDNSSNESFAVLVKTYLDGEGTVYPADSYYVAHILNKIERFKKAGRDWMASIPKFAGTYSFGFVKECVCAE